MAGDGEGGSARRPEAGKPGRQLGLAGAAGGGFEFAIAILVGVFGGQWLDRRLGTGPWLLMLGVFVGAAAGFFNLYRSIATTGQRRSSSRTADEDREDAP